MKELYELTMNSAYFAAKKFIKIDQDALDIVQDSYITAFTKLSQLNDGSKFPQWLNKIVSNKAKDYLKKKKPMLFSDTTSEDQNVEEFIADDAFDFQPKKNYDYQELKEFMSNVIDNLSDENRMCIIMFYFQQLSIAEIADVFDISQNTVKSRLNYGKKQIKKDLETSESKGILFRGIAPIPFMLWTLSELARSSSIPIETGASFFSTILSETPVLVNSIIAASNTESIKETVVKIAAGLSLLTATTIGGVAIANNYITPPEVKAAIFIPIEIEMTEAAPIKKESITWVKEPSWTFDTAPIPLYGKGFLVEKNGKHGFIGADGALLVDYEFTFNKCLGEGAYQYSIKPNENDDVIYLSDLVGVSYDNRACLGGFGGVRFPISYSLIDKKVYTPIVDETFDETKIKKKQYFDDQNKVVFIYVGELEERYKEVTEDRYMLFNGRDIISEEIYDEYKTYEVIPTIDKEIFGSAVVRQKDKWALVNIHGERITDFKYNDLTVLSMDYIKYSNVGEVGLLNTEGEIFVKGEYEDITAPSQNTVMIRKNGIWGIASIDSMEK